MNFKMDPETVRYTLEKHIEDEARLLKGDDGRVYARFKSVDGVEIVSVNSTRFEEWLMQHCIKYSITINRQAIKLAITSTKSKRWTKVDRVCVRVGTAMPYKEVYWDLADKTGRAVHITAAGWRIVENPNVLFPTHQSRWELAELEKGGSIHRLRDMFGLSAHDEALIVSFCLGCLRGAGPYPILLITGPDSCGKTALARYLRALLDPSALDLRNLPKKEEELAVTARDNHLLAYDDVHAVPPVLGAAICKLSKGTTFSAYSVGREQVLFRGARPIVLAGDDEMLLSRELTSRALMVRLAPRTNFTPNTDDVFEGLPEIRGALLNIVSHGLARWHDVNIPNPVRDYEFEKWIAACEISRWGLGVYLEAYEANVLERLADLVELDPFLTAVRDYMGKMKTFRGTAGDMLRELNAAGSVAKGNRWPETPRGLSVRLRRDAKLLPEIEIEFGIKKGRNRDRLMVANLKFSTEQIQDEDDEPRKVRSEASAASRRKALPKKSSMTALPLFPTG